MADLTVDNLTVQGNMAVQGVGTIQGDHVLQGSLDVQGDLTKDGTVLSGPFALSARTLSADATIPAGYSAVVVGPLTIEDGVTLNIEDGGVLAILEEIP